MHERQAVIFGVLLAALAVTGLGAAAVYTGNLDLPGLDRAIAQEPTPTDAAKGFPCPPVGAFPVPYASVTINVLNTTGRSGLAGATATALEERGFLIGTTDDAEPYDGVARITFGLTGVTAAYTVKAQFPEAQLVMTGSKDKAVNVALGTKYSALQPIDKVGLDGAIPLVVPAGCTSYEELVAQAATPAATPAG
jgi:hypothetical protein